MSTELAVINNNTEVAQYEEEEGNWDESEPLQPQYISLKQALTEGFDHLSNGTFFNRASGQVWENNTIKMVILRMFKTRAWKPSAPKYVEGEKAVCRSTNGRTPLPKSEFNIPQASSCASCPKNSWAGYDKVTKTGPKPTCERGFFILFIDAETHLPYIYSIRGQGVDGAEAMYDAMRQQASIEKAKTGKMPSSFHYQVTMTSEKGNKAHKAKFTTLTRMKPEDADKFGPLYKQYVTDRNQNIEEQAVQDAPVDEAPDTGAVMEEDEVVAI